MAGLADVPFGLYEIRLSVQLEASVDLLADQLEGAAWRQPVGVEKCREVPLVFIAPPLRRMVKETDESTRERLCDFVGGPGAARRRGIVPPRVGSLQGVQEVLLVQLRYLDGQPEEDLVQPHDLVVHQRLALPPPPGHGLPDD